MAQSPATPQTQDFGIKISRPGWDVNTCPDYELLFNSAWPSIAVAFDKVITLPIANGSYGSTSVSIDHNLNFYAFTVMWLIDNNGNSLGTIDPSGFFYVQYEIGINTIYITTYDTNNAWTINVKCYNIDLSKYASYNLPTSSASALPPSNTYGIKVTKFNKSISSQDLRDFILHSRAQSPAVLSVVTEKTPNAIDTQYASSGFNLLTYNTPRDYVPWLFSFYARTDSSIPNESRLYVPASYGTQAVGAGIEQLDDGTYQLSVPIFLNDSNSIGATIIVLRDPLFASKDIEVTY